MVMLIYYSLGAMAVSLPASLQPDARCVPRTGVLRMCCPVKQPMYAAAVARTPRLPPL